MFSNFYELIGGVLMSTQPSWALDIKDGSLTDSQFRHDWMCDQLMMRRRRQMDLQNHLDQQGHIAATWYNDYFLHIFKEIRVKNVIEVLSDGLGFLEPNWSALKSSPIEHAGVSKLSGPALDEKKRQVKKARRELYHGQNSKQHFKTQRTIGRHLFEPGLFLIVNDAIYYCQIDDSGGCHYVGKRVTWIKLSEASDFELMPLRDPDDKANENIGSSLHDITKSVLWPTLLPKISDQKKCFSLVLMQTSLWQETAGVWAMHVLCDGDVGAPIYHTFLQSIRPLIAPPILCLSDTLGWSCEYDGMHHFRKDNYYFFKDISGFDRTPWTLDGVDDTGGVTVSEVDKSVYYLSPCILPSDMACKIFTLAVGEYFKCRFQMDIQSINVDLFGDDAKKIKTIAQLSVIGLRLFYLSSSPVNNLPNFHLEDNKSEIPSPASLYLSLAETKAGLPCNESLSEIERCEKLYESLEAKLENLTGEIELNYCSSATECLSNYIKALKKYPSPSHIGCHLR